MNEILSLIIEEFSQLFCKQLLCDPPESSSSTTNSTNYLRYDRLLHELISGFCDEIVGLEAKLARAQQIVSILLCENRIEGQEMVDEWKKEGICTLRAGEILLLLNNKKD